MGELIIAETQDLIEIANAIREKTNGTKKYSVSQMADAIRDISSGGVLAQYGFFVAWNPVKVPFSGYKVLNINYIDSGISVADAAE